MKLTTRQRAFLAERLPEAAGAKTIEELVNTMYRRGIAAGVREVLTRTGQEEVLAVFEEGAAEEGLR